jgi:hypothetical protein
MAAASGFRRNSRPLDPELDLSYADHVSNHPYMSRSNLATPATSSLFGGQESQDQHPSLQGPFHPPAHYQPHSQYLSSRLPESENPFSAPSDASSYSQSQHPDVDPFMEQTSTVSSGQRKSGMAGLTGYKPSRFVLHTDAEDDIPPNEDGVVELPPQYSATRPPAKGLQQATSTSFSSPPL